MCALALSGLCSQPVVTCAKDLAKTVYVNQSIEVPFAIDCMVSVDKHVGDVSSAFFAFDDFLEICFIKA